MIDRRNVITSYFKPACPLPTPQETGIGESATRETNDAVKRVLAGQQAKEPAAKKRKVYTAFNKDSQRVQIGRYAAENGNAAVLRKFRQEIPDLGESTVRLFKKRYLEELRFWC